MDKTHQLLFIATSVLIVVHTNAVTVNPSLCPTNKIAPHRRMASWEQSRPRTLGLIYSLLSRPRPSPTNDLEGLQEQPQEDDPDDCGEIEDYDETDLSSITSSAQNQVYNNREHRLFFGDNYVIPPYYSAPNRPPSQRPSKPQRPQRPTYSPFKPPYSSSGIYGSNNYQPPSQHYPSNNIKPVHESSYDRPQAVYRPSLIGGTVGHVVGFPPVRPTVSDESEPLQKKPNSAIRFPDSDAYKKRLARAKPPNIATGIIESFVDLLFN